MSVAITLSAGVFPVPKRDAVRCGGRHAAGREHGAISSTYHIYSFVMMGKLEISLQLWCATLTVIDDFASGNAVPHRSDAGSVVSSWRVRPSGRRSVGWPSSWWRTSSATVSVSGCIAGRPVREVCGTTPPPPPSRISRPRGRTRGVSVGPGRSAVM